MSQRNIQSRLIDYRLYIDRILQIFGDNIPHLVDILSMKMVVNKRIFKLETKISMNVSMMDLVRDSTDCFNLDCHLVFINFCP
jgi:aryl-phospho-beta-D-glucosidase BglC (GH1 family)